MRNVFVGKTAFSIPGFGGDLHKKEGDTFTVSGRNYKIQGGELYGKHYASPNAPYEKVEPST